ncbi:MAG: DUF6198 family protein [Bacillota bacterium]|nr:DUF6198 family protein [Bacillota bacterium]
MKKKTFYTELSYILGILAFALGTSLMEKANFGMSMVTAPAYLIYLKISKYLAFFTFGMACYVFQLLLIILLIVILRKAKLSYLFSFFTAVFFGVALDGIELMLSLLPTAYLALRVIYFVLSVLVIAMGVSLIFHTYIPPEAYELFVKEIAIAKNLNINVFKTVYDISSLVLSVCLSFTFFGMGQFVGIHFGTIICAIMNGFMISRFSKFFNDNFKFKDKLPLRKYIQ